MSIELELSEILNYCKELKQRTRNEGIPLSEKFKNIALEAGVKNVDSIHILEIDNIPVPMVKGIQRLIDINQLNDKSIKGLALGYDIILEKNYSTIFLAHELRHVAQFELFNSFEDFITIYLKEIEKFGYGKGPLERDAKTFVLENLIKVYSY